MANNVFSGTLNPTQSITTLLPYPTSSLPKIPSELHELQKWSGQSGCEQLLYLLHTSYATGQNRLKSSKNWR